MTRLFRRGLAALLFVGALGLATSAQAQDGPRSTPTEPTTEVPSTAPDSQEQPSRAPSARPTPSARPAPTPRVQPQPGGGARITPDEQRPDPIGDDGRYKINDMDASLWDLVMKFSNLFERDFIVSDVKELQGKKVNIVSYHEVTKDEAWQAFLAAMETAGYTITTSGNISKVVKAQDAGTTPIDVRTGKPYATSDAYITQLIQLDNVSVSEVNKVVSNMVPPEAKVIAYAPTNTLIITDTANNLRKVYEVLAQLDVAAPKSRLVIYPIQYAEAGEVKRIIEELYGTAETDDTPAPTPTRRRTRRTRTRASTPTNTESVTAGKESKYISKVLEDERSNSIIVLANEQGHEAVIMLLAEIDVDVDPQNRAQIHVVYLEHAKAEEVSAVLAELSDGSGSTQQRRTANQTPAQRAREAALAARRGQTAQSGGEESEGSGAIAAFDSGMRIAADENTNSLVIIANNEDFQVVETVINQLDIERKQVFVDAVILELSSEDTFDLGLAAHLPVQPDQNAVGFVGGQFGTQSLALTQDVLSGLAVGVFGEGVSVPFADPTGTGTLDVTIPAFGIVLNALKTNSSTNIISNPNILTLDNQEAEIVVGRRVPFPQTGGLTNFGSPLTTFQREDVAITLKVTPRVNSSNFVTLEVELEVQEIEEDDSNLAIQGGGPITSKRQEKTTVLVADNETVVLGGLVGSTDNEVETKLPVVGDLPLIGAFFRGKRKTSRKTNMIVFLTPHIIDDELDMYEVQRVKEAQRQEFLRRFYGKSRDEYMKEMRALLRYSMNQVDEPSMYRGPTSVRRDFTDDAPFSDETITEVESAVEDGRGMEPGAGAGDLPEEDLDLGIPVDPVDGPQPDEGEATDGETGEADVPADETGGQ